MNGYVTTTNATPAQTLRAALKAAKLSSRRVTVRHDRSTLRVTIRDASASLSKVQAIADQFVSVHRCEATGEILCGGNTFVDEDLGVAGWPADQRAQHAAQQAAAM